ncbi:MAG: peptide-methionine (S)-S-oxide reductase MsrA [Xanthomonadales bacterium]|nr:peptide-methionine (S)-S-oxide reductase MsrA [Xanthomonadales bacterium]
MKPQGEPNPSFDDAVIDPDQALPGRAEPLPLDNQHLVLATPLRGDFPGMQRAVFAMGCFWGVERLFWQLPGVVSTAAGYTGGITPNPTYAEVCSGRTGHAEAVQVIYDPAHLDYAQLLRTFWENHDPTQGMRQGNDIGSQYRSAIQVLDEQQRELALASREQFQQRLTAAGLATISTQVLSPSPFYYAENEHQQYLARHPHGYCGLAGTGVSCPIGLDMAQAAGG